MGNQIEKQPRKKRQASPATNDLNQRVTAIENTVAAQHSEIMRILSEMSLSMKEGFKSLTLDVKDQAIKQATQDRDVVANATDIKRLDSKLSRIMGGVGAVALTIVGGIFTLAARYFVR